MIYSAYEPFWATPIQATLLLTKAEAFLPALVTRPLPSYPKILGDYTPSLKRPLIANLSTGLIGVALT